MSRFATVRLTVGWVLLVWGGTALAVTFSPVEKITDGAHKYRLSRNPTRSLAVDGSGTLHAVYWWGGLATSPTAPSRIVHRTWRPLEGWSEPSLVDDSFVQSGPQAGQRIGGRNPSLAFAGDGTLWIAWQDHRHCTGTPGRWIDNIEIYADRLPPGGAFLDGDMRLTNTAAGHLGDNGYVPMLTTGPDGRLHATWYDYHFDYDISDIFLKSSDAAGNWNLSEAMADLRVTVAGERGGVPAYTVPDAAVDGNGMIHQAWTDGTTSQGNLYYARLDAGGTVLERRQLFANAASFFDPPRLHADPAGDVWLVWTDRRAGQEEIYLMRRRAGAADFDAALRLTDDPTAQYHPAVAVDAGGLAHVAWVDEGDGTRLMAGVFDPDGQAWIERQPVTTASAPWASPCIYVDAVGNVYLLFERDTGSNTGDLYFTTTAVFLPSGVEDWRLYR